LSWTGLRSPGSPKSSTTRPISATTSQKSRLRAGFQLRRLHEYHLANAALRSRLRRGSDAGPASPHARKATHGPASKHRPIHWRMEEIAQIRSRPPVWPLGKRSSVERGRRRGGNLRAQSGYCRAARNALPWCWRRRSAPCLLALQSRARLMFGIGLSLPLLAVVAFTPAVSDFVQTAPVNERILGGNVAPNTRRGQLRNTICRRSSWPQ